MADIFISYSQKDRDRVKRLVDALTAEGYEVWWDLKIRAGESFDELIESTLERVSCVVGVWSQNSVRSEWVRAESAWAKDQGIFVSVRVDDAARLPLKFYHVHTVSLAAWGGSRDDPRFRRLVADIGELAGPSRSPVQAASTAAQTADSSPDFTMPPKARDSELCEPEMVRIEPGSFQMGSPAGKGYDEERPQHVVGIGQAFAIGKYPVTFEEYDAFAKARKRDLPADEGWGRGRKPVINVSWVDAVAYTQWLSTATGKGFRLPTEAEWEYVCRAATETRWFFGDEGGDLDLYAWYSANAGGQTHPVGEKQPNPWGLHDVYGNVLEWVRDCWHDSYQEAPTDGSAWEKGGGGDCDQRVVRGGSWNGKRGNLRSAFRYRLHAGLRSVSVGFRLAQDL